VKVRKWVFTQETRHEKKGVCSVPSYSIRPHSASATCGVYNYHDSHTKHLQHKLQRNPQACPITERALYGSSKYRISSSVKVTSVPSAVHSFSLHISRIFEGEVHVLIRSSRFLILVEPMTGAVTCVKDHAKETCAMLIPRFLDISSTLFKKFLIKPLSRTSKVTRPTCSQFPWCLVLADMQK
jgi:hypothetical protein